MLLCWLRYALQSSPTDIRISEFYQLSGTHGVPYGLHDSLCTLRTPCSPENLRLRHVRHTRYGWMASPYPTGTCTLQDTPGFAWRSNASHQRQSARVADILSDFMRLLYPRFLCVFRSSCPELRFCLLPDLRLFPARSASVLSCPDLRFFFSYLLYNF